MLLKKGVFVDRIENTDRLIWVELIRFIAAFAILVWHYQHFFFCKYEMGNLQLETRPFDSIFSLFYEYGMFGVQVFWAISGYIFFFKYKKPIHEGKISGLAFFILRFSRLYPLHFITFVFVAIMQNYYADLNGYYFVYRNNDWGRALLNLFMAENWVNLNFSFNGPAWTVSAEVLIYAVFYWFCLLRWNKVFMPFIVSFGSFLLYIHTDHHLLQCCALFFMGGCLQIIRDIGNYKIFTASIVAISLLLIICGASGVFCYLYLLAFMACMSVVFDNFGFTSTKLGKLSGRYIQFLGSITYSMYLLHFPIQITIVTFADIFNIPILQYSALLFACFIIITFFVSVLSYFYFERPVQTFIRKKMLK